VSSSTAGNASTQPVSGLAQRPSDNAVALIIFVASCLYLLPFRLVTNFDPDEGIVLQGAQRILHGQVLYRDFFSFYTPGSFYLNAAILRIFGDTFGAARGALLIYGAVFPVFTFLVARRTCSRQTSLITALLVTMTVLPYRFLVLHNWDSTLWCCLAVFCATRWFEHSAFTAAFGTGTFASLALLSEQSKGTGLYFGLFLGWTVLFFSGYRVRRLASMIMGALWPVVITVAYFWRKGALVAMHRCLVWPFHNYSAANQVRYGDMNWSNHARDILFHNGTGWIRILKAVAVSPNFIMPVLPIISLGLLFHWTRQFRRKPNTDTALRVWISSLLCGLLVSVVIVRADIIHFMYLAPFFYLILAWGMESGLGIPRQVRIFLKGYVLLAFGLMGVALLVGALGADTLTQTRRGPIKSHGGDTAISYLLKSTHAGDLMYVHPYLPLYYFLTATENPCPLDFFQPGMSSADQAQGLVNCLHTSRVERVLLEPEFSDKISASWPNTPLNRIAVDPIADYVARNYRVCRHLSSAAGWNFEFMVRKEKENLCL
jgi:hypothetical protein